MLLPHLIKNVNYGGSKAGVEVADKLEHDAKTFIKVVDDFLRTAKQLGQGQNFPITGMIDAYNKKHKSEIQKIDFLSFKPIKFVESIAKNWDDVITPRINESAILHAPRGKMDDVITVAEQIGLLIVPTEFVNQNVIEQISSPHPECRNRYISTVYSNFVKQAQRQGLRAWLVCPIGYYSISHHAKNMDFEPFIPSHIQQAFTSIKIILPMLVGMIKQIDDLSSQVKTLSSTYDGVKATLVAQQNQINRLANDLDNMRKEKVRNEAARRYDNFGEGWWSERPYISSITSSYNDFWSYDNRVMSGDCYDLFEDPLLIAVPESVTDINKYKGSVVLGPAWGADIDPLLIDLLGLTQVPGRKNYIQTEFNRYVG